MSAAVVLGSCSTSGGITFDQYPVTRPIGGVPETVRFARPVPWVMEESGWFGNDALWVSLPPGDVLPSLVSIQDPGFLETKFPWWRVEPGNLEVTAVSVGDDEVVEGHVTDGYGDIGFTPSSLLFKTSGCWEVTGSLGEHTLSFVIWVCETEHFGASLPRPDLEACGAA